VLCVRICFSRASSGAVHGVGLPSQSPGADALKGPAAWSRQGIASQQGGGEDAGLELHVVEGG
jgi:hypothetical protein